MREHGVEYASATPTFWRFLLTELHADGGPVPALRQITLAARPCRTAAPRPAEAFPDARVSQIYAASSSARPARSVTAHGMPVRMLDRGEDADVAMKIVDGELWVRSRARDARLLRRGAGGRRRLAAHR